MDLTRLRFDQIPADAPVVQVQRQRGLARLLAFAGWTIDDVVSNPIAKRDVYRWYKTDRRLHRRLDVIELEKQWNGVK